VTGSACYGENCNGNIGPFTEAEMETVIGFLKGEPVLTEIATAEMLKFFAMMVNSGHSFESVALTADIVLNPDYVDEWESWEALTPEAAQAQGLEQWTPIGNLSNPFQGTFDGQGHTISGIYINNEDEFQGLFGENSGTIQNVGVVKSFIKGYRYVGGVVGLNSTNITNSYNTGTVMGIRSDVGGVVGNNYFDANVSNSYNTGKVTGKGVSAEYVGGVVGRNFGPITNSYNTGAVSMVEAEPRGVGGVAGAKNKIANSYTLAGQTKRGDEIITEDEDLTDGEMKLINSFANWSFSGDSPWRIVNGKTYPYLSWEKDIADAVAENPTYTGAQALPTLYYENPKTGSKTQLVKDKDYTIETDLTQGDYTTAGPKTIGILGKGTYRGYKDLAYTITQADDPTYALPTDLTGVEGAELSTVTLPERWAWASTDALIQLGVMQYAAIYTPADEVNYKTVTENLTVTGVLPSSSSAEIQSSSSVETLPSSSSVEQSSSSSEAQSSSSAVVASSSSVELSSSSALAQSSSSVAETVSSSSVETQSSSSVVVASSSSSEAQSSSSAVEVSSSSTQAPEVELSSSSSEAPTPVVANPENPLIKKIKVQTFDLHGNRIHGTPTTPGVYIVRQGSQTRTIVVR
jgi:hypothetical protein